MVQGHVASDQGWLVILSRPCRSGEDDPGVEAIGSCVHKRRALNTRLSSGTSAGTFACPVGPYRNCRGKVGTKNETKWYFVPVQKKGSESRSSRFKPKISISFSRGSGPPLKTKVFLLRTRRFQAQYLITAHHLLGSFCRAFCGAKTWSCGSQPHKMPRKNAPQKKISTMNPAKIQIWTPIFLPALGFFARLLKTFHWAFLRGLLRGCVPQALVPQQTPQNEPSCFRYCWTWCANCVAKWQKKKSFLSVCLTQSVFYVGMLYAKWYQNLISVSCLVTLRIRLKSSPVPTVE